MVRESTSRQKMLFNMPKYVRKQHSHLSSDSARTLLHNEIPKYYTWNNGNKAWQHRKQGQVVLDQPEIKSCNALGRVYTVQIQSTDEYQRNFWCFLKFSLLISP
ncbi:hypothetical protein AVEN_55975-1 [Araneus ventricosus]|uniref:Uncharacterized protein n=1 Tax=Araneus ventricosus TaxID=182803 RepID=A0A4Y2GMK2_ARAVE|nr:hypothetical protein AVEN_55975-1 [Araneus ventricosus]